MTTFWRSTIVMIVVLNVFFLGFVFFFLSSPRIVYIDTGKLMVGFSEASAVDRQVKVEDDAWRSQLKVLADSLQAQMTVMSREYNAATPAHKKELQDMLSARNQQVNNFREANIQKIEQLREKKIIRWLFQDDRVC